MAAACNQHLAVVNKLWYKSVVLMAVLTVIATACCLMGLAEHSVNKQTLARQLITSNNVSDSLNASQMYHGQEPQSYQVQQSVKYVRRVCVKMGQSMNGYITFHVGIWGPPWIFVVRLESMQRRQFACTDILLGSAFNNFPLYCQYKLPGHQEYQLCASNPPNADKMNMFQFHADANFQGIYMCDSSSCTQGMRQPICDCF